MKQTFFSLIQIIILVSLGIVILTQMGCVEGSEDLNPVEEFWECVSDPHSQLPDEVWKQVAQELFTRYMDLGRGLNPDLSDAELLSLMSNHETLVGQAQECSVETPQ